MASSSSARSSPSAGPTSTHPSPSPINIQVDGHILHTLPTSALRALVATNYGTAAQTKPHATRPWLLQRAFDVLAAGESNAASSDFDEETGLFAWSSVLSPGADPLLVVLPTSSDEQPSGDPPPTTSQPPPPLALPLHFNPTVDATTFFHVACPELIYGDEFMDMTSSSQKDVGVKPDSIVLWDSFEAAARYGAQPASTLSLTSTPLYCKATIKSSAPPLARWRRPIHRSLRRLCCSSVKTQPDHVLSHIMMNPNSHKLRQTPIFLFETKREGILKKLPIGDDMRACYALGASGVSLVKNALEQLLGYLDAEGVRYGLLTSFERSYFVRRDDGKDWGVSRAILATARTTSTTVSWRHGTLFQETAEAQLSSPWGGLEGAFMASLAAFHGSVLQPLTSLGPGLAMLGVPPRWDPGAVRSKSSADDDVSTNWAGNRTLWTPSPISLMQGEQSRVSLVSLASKQGDGSDPAMDSPTDARALAYAWSLAVAERTVLEGIALPPPPPVPAPPPGDDDEPSSPHSPPPSPFGPGSLPPPSDRTHGRLRPRATTTQAIKEGQSMSEWRVDEVKEEGPDSANANSPTVLRRLEEADIEHFRDEWIGDGATARVFRAAIKYVDLAKVENAESIVHAEIEAYTALRDLQGTVIPRFIDGGRLPMVGVVAVEEISPGRVFGAMAWSDLSPTDQDLAKEALRKLHAKGYVHGDMRLPNLMFAQGGGGGRRAVWIDIAGARRATAEEMREEEEELAGM
ncbi:hypothetical protein BDK51DRAFT_34064 [Blyttiomyces helicus]|uniref:Protein kinase domain-containing protein n=1 Tax=Blyttiomyces helicus TaxID=388810 RepID=A0A4P9WRV9_9FUNG|nr:hypothetical protein BDK51DRAFT_34064 [Blyttiomyces helicus]|eukprot:RKO94040.1 hypothetical protein BDK51DRAFT_34064 [Blyttiomyces helicus]